MNTVDVARSCDTFVVLSPLTDSNLHIFGKNSDRPSNEIQEIIFVNNERSKTTDDRVQVELFFDNDHVNDVFVLI
jgi:hypothetical protein